MTSPTPTLSDERLTQANDLYRIAMYGDRGNSTAMMDRIRAILAANEAAPAASGNLIAVDRGALTMALNVLRRAGKHEVADALAQSVPDEAAPALTNQLALHLLANPLELQAFVEAAEKNADDWLALNREVAELRGNEATPSARMTEAEIHAHTWWCPHCRKDVLPEMVTKDGEHYLESGGCGRSVRGERIDEAAPAAVPLTDREEAKRARPPSDVEPWVVADDEGLRLTFRTEDAAWRYRNENTDWLTNPTVTYEPASPSVTAAAPEGWRTSADGLTRTRLAPDAAAAMLPSPMVSVRFPPGGAAPAAAAVWAHVVRGGEYTVIGSARLQTDKPLTDMAEVVAYRDADGRVWVRDAHEFDARFTRIRAASPSVEGVGSETDQRARFEAAMRSKHPEWAFTADPVFDYHNERTRCAWEGWQAALTAPASPSPAGPSEPVAASDTLLLAKWRTIERELTPDQYAAAKVIVAFGRSLYAASAAGVQGDGARTIEACPELNMSNFDDIDVDRLNDWAIRADAEIDRLTKASEPIGARDPIGFAHHLLARSATALPAGRAGTEGGDGKGVSRGR